MQAATFTLSSTYEVLYVRIALSTLLHNVITMLEALVIRTPWLVILVNSVHRINKPFSWAWVVEA